jgi:hypothetical protein
MSIASVQNFFPTKGVSDDTIEIGVFRYPIQFAPYKVRIGDHSGGIARPPPAGANLKRMTYDLFYAVDDFKDGIAASIPAICDQIITAGPQTR